MHDKDLRIQETGRKAENEWRWMMCSYVSPSIHHDFFLINFTIQYQIVHRFIALLQVYVNPLLGYGFTMINVVKTLSSIWHLWKESPVSELGSSPAGEMKWCSYRVSRVTGGSISTIRNDWFYWLTTVHDVAVNGFNSATCHSFNKYQWWKKNTTFQLSARKRVSQNVSSWRSFFTKSRLWECELWKWLTCWCRFRAVALLLLCCITQQLLQHQ